MLILFYPHAGQIYFPLILRPTYSGVHSGQVGLPGGGYEEIDDGMAGHGTPRDLRRGRRSSQSSHVARPVDPALCLCL